MKVLFFIVGLQAFAYAASLPQNTVITELNVGTVDNLESLTRSKRHPAWGWLTVITDNAKEGINQAGSIVKHVSNAAAGIGSTLENFGKEPNASNSGEKDAKAV
jgi:hypothetical protein